MNVQMQTAPRLASESGPNLKAVAAPNYLIPNINAKEIAASRLARRFGLSLALARSVCELAGIGGLRA